MGASNNCFSQAPYRLSLKFVLLSEGCATLKIAEQKKYEPQGLNKTHRSLIGLTGAQIF